MSHIRLVPARLLFSGKFRHVEGSLWCLFRTRHSLHPTAVSRDMHAIFRVAARKHAHKLALGRAVLAAQVRRRE
jgi:hypothetical protein